MAAAQAYRPTVSQYDGTGATRLRTTRTNSQQQLQHQYQHQQQQSTTTQGGGSCTQPPPPPQSHQQYSSSIGCSSNSGNGSTIAISTITNAPSLSRVRRTCTYVHFIHTNFPSFFSAFALGRKEERYGAICQKKNVRCKFVQSIIDLEKNPIF